MKIAQVSPLYESVPPKCYGGTERVVSYLTEELVKMGHDVTLYASGDSVTKARLRAPCASSLRTDHRCREPFAHQVLMLEMLLQEMDEYDVIHSHIEYLPYPMFRRASIPTVTTLHGRMDLHDLVRVYREFRDLPLVSISHSQRKPMPWVNWHRTVYHGLPEDLYPFCEKSGGYLAFLGRIAPEKRVDRAIEIATRVGMPLKIAAKVDKADREYFEAEIEPLLANPLVEYLGEITDKEKGDFLGGALATLFPIDWPEPFGMVMIESMACGTPVIAARCGSVPEVIDDGVTGIIIDSVADGVKAVELAASMSRRKVRQTFERRFSAERMASDYLRVYGELQFYYGKVKLAANI